MGDGRLVNELAEGRDLHSLLDPSYFIIQFGSRTLLLLFFLGFFSTWGQAIVFTYFLQEYLMLTPTVTSWPSFHFLLLETAFTWAKAAFADGILQIKTEASNSTILTFSFHTTGKCTLLTFLAQLGVRKIRDLTEEVEIKIFKWLGTWNKHLVSWASPAVDVFEIFPFINSDTFAAAKVHHCSCC